MKKTRFGFIMGTVLVVAAVMIAVPILLKDLFWSQPTVIQTRVSPDGTYTAYVFESNAGATTGWIYHISVLPTGKELSKGPGNVYIGTLLPDDISWIDNITLFVSDYASKGTTRQKEKIGNIRIKYRSLETKGEHV